MTDLVYDNWGNAVEIDRLYEELEPRFYLATTTLPDFQIDEPAGWADLQFVHQRDKDYHGFNYEFTDGNLDLQFDREAGMVAIEEEYAGFGNDGNVRLKRVVMYAAAPAGMIVEYVGRLNLNTRKKEGYTVRASVERESLHQLVGARLDSKISLSDPKDLDGGNITVPALKRCYLPSRSITQSLKSKVAIQEEVFYSQRGDAYLWIKFNTSNPTLTQIERTASGIPLGVVNNDPITNGGHLIKFAAGGLYDIVISLDYAVYFKINPRTISIGKKITSYTLDTTLVHVRPGKFTNLYPITTTRTGSPNDRKITISGIVGSLTLSLPVLAEDELYIHAPFAFTHNANELSSIEMRVTSYLADISIVGSSKAEGTVASGVLIGTVLESLTRRITGAEDRLRSDFYGKANAQRPADGCGANLMLTNGGRIRNAEADKFPITVTMKDTLSDLQALYNTGMGYEWDTVLQEEVIRMEPIGYFYQDVEIMQIVKTGDYREEVARDTIYNQVEIGYQKYNEQAANSLDEVHAYHEYQTPIKTEGNKYVQRCKAIASAYLIETTRRAQFSEDPQKATIYDDDLFIIHVKDSATGSSAYPIEVFTGNPPTYLPRINFAARPLDGDGQPINLRPNSLITLSGTANNNGTFRVTGVEDFLDYVPNPIYSVLVDSLPFVMVNETAPAATVTFYEYDPVRDEPFTSVTGLIDPPSAMNLMLTPKRMLLNHSQWLLGGLIYKYRVQIIKNTFAKQNGEMVTQLTPAYPCPGGDSLKVALLEKGDLALEDFGLAESLHSPEWIECRARLSKNDFRYIVTALRGGNTETPSRNYGYLTVDDDTGQPATGWPYEIRYNREEEEATFRLLKKKIRDFTA